MNFDKHYPKIDFDKYYPKLDPKKYDPDQQSKLEIGFSEKGKHWLDIESLNTHMHVIGLTGTGKSFFLDLLMRQILAKDSGFCLIDPLGGLYHAMVHYIAEHPQYAERVVFFDPTQPSPYVVGYNPLQYPEVQDDDPYSPDVSVKVDGIVNSLLKVFETDEVIAQTLKNMLRNSVRPTLQAGLTLYELGYFVAGDKDVRNLILSRCDSPFVQDDWNRHDDLPKKEQIQQLLSFRNRVRDFAESKMFKAVIAQTSHTINIPDIIEKKKVLLVNVSPNRHYFSQIVGRMIGTLLVNDIYEYALDRTIDRGKKNPFYLIMDEMHYFLTPNVGTMLYTCRQKGIHLVLAHQNLNQLLSKHLDPETAILDAVQDMARTKVIFSASPQDAGRLARHFVHEWPLDQIKQQMFRTTVLNYRLEKLYANAWGTAKSKGLTLAESESESYQEIDSFSESEGSTDSSGNSHASGLLTGSADIRSYNPQDTLQQTLSHSVSTLSSSVDAWQNAYTATALSSQTHSSGYATTTSKSKALSEALSEAQSVNEQYMLMPIIGKELTNEECFSFQEQEFMQMQRIVGLENQWAIIKVPGKSSTVVKIKTILPAKASIEKIKKVFELSAKAHPEFYLPFEERMLQWGNSLLQLSKTKELPKEQKQQLLPKADASSDIIDLPDEDLI